MEGKPGWHMRSLDSDGSNVWSMCTAEYQQRKMLRETMNYCKTQVAWSYFNSIDFTIISDTEFITIETAKPDPKEYVTHWKYFNE